MNKPCHRRDGTWLNNKGYAICIAGGKLWLAHRLTWTEMNGEIPVGLEVDHDAIVCGNRWCDEITHLRLLTHRENLLAGDTLPARNAAKEVCPKRHAYDVANTYISKAGKRHCRTCDRDRHRLAAASGKD